eukprot:7037856-Prymnesium_polylepis.1
MDKVPVESSLPGTGGLEGCRHTKINGMAMRGGVLGMVSRFHICVSHHSLEHCGPDCSSMLVPPTTPGGHAYGKSEFSSPALSSNVMPWRIKSQRPAGAGSV